MTDQPRGMRKGLTRYGDEGFSLYLRKSFIKAMGYTDDALDRPIVGITNTFSGYNACHGNVPDLVEAIKRGVMLAESCGLASEPRESRQLVGEQETGADQCRQQGELGG